MLNYSKESLMRCNVVVIKIKLLQIKKITEIKQKNKQTSYCILVNIFSIMLLILSVIDQGQNTLEIIFSVSCLN